MLRRVHVPSITQDQIPLEAGEAHHLRNVLRMGKGSEVEVFDDAGNSARGRLIFDATGGIAVRIEAIKPPACGLQLTIASALPKGERADWMIEKLSELGVTRLVPLATARSVVHPAGTGKLQRWRRIATESAKQSRRTGVMQIDALMPIAALLPSLSAGAYYLSPSPDAPSIYSVLQEAPSSTTTLALLIGPEGGWSNQEIESFRIADVRALRLTDTILRVETAAIAAATITLTFLQNPAPPFNPMRAA